MGRLGHHTGAETPVEGKQRGVSIISNVQLINIDREFDSSNLNASR